MIKVAILVFLARMLDVSLGTVKFKSMMRGNRLAACSIAFVEVTVYVLAASKAFQLVHDPLVLLFYASGYAAGNFIGMTIDEKLAKGNMMLLIITDNNNQGLADELREKGFGVTTSKGYGLNGSEKIQLLVVLPKSRYAELRTVLDSNENENGMYTAILDVKDAFSTKMATPRK